MVVLDRFNGREVATLPAPPGGFKLPFTLRVPAYRPSGCPGQRGFPPVGPPVVYDYDYGTERHGFKAKLTRSVNFAGQPMGFAEDVEVLPDGQYVVSESIFGGLWLISRNGRSAAAWCPMTARPAAGQPRPLPVPAAGRRRRRAAVRGARPVRARSGLARGAR